MRLTPKLKGWLHDHAGVAADATDDVYRDALGKSLADGVLKIEDAKAMSEEEDEVTPVKSALDEILSLSRANAERLDKLEQPKAAEGAPKAPAVDMGGDVRVKKASERYDDTKSVVTYPDYDASGRRNAKAGQPLVVGQRTINRPTQLALAKCGAWFKFVLANAKRPLRQAQLNDHEKQLVEEMLNEGRWAGVVSNGKTQCYGTEDGGTYVDHMKLADAGVNVKAVIDDATSGGLEINPIEFDDAVITIPQLHGEFYPYVREQVVNRGTRMEGALLQNVTVSWNNADDTAVSLFNTSGFVSAFDTTIHECAGAIQLGLNLLSDTPVQLGSHVVESYGQTLASELDRVVTSGTGVGEPTGIMVAAGTVSVSAANPGGAITVGDIESLLFGVTKKYRQLHDRSACRFGMTETTYQRARAIAVGGSDARRVFGMDHESYMLLDHPVGISEDMTNVQRFFGCMPRYRMYRRAGATFRQSTEGDTLVRKNLLLIVMRARYGGQIEDGSAFAITTNGQA